MADVGKRKTREQKREKERERERNKRDQVVVFGAFTTDDSQAGIAVNCPFTKNVPKGVGDGEIWSLKDFALEDWPTMNEKLKSQHSFFTTHYPYSCCIRTKKESTKCTRSDS